MATVDSTRGQFAKHSSDKKSVKSYYRKTQVFNLCIEQKEVYSLGRVYFKRSRARFGRFLLETGLGGGGISLSKGNGSMEIVGFFMRRPMFSAMVNMLFITARVSLKVSASASF